MNVYFSQYDKIENMVQKMVGKYCHNNGVTHFINSKFRMCIIE